MGQPFPLSAIVGQDEMKMVLLAAAMDPAAGYPVVFGDRGAGKSTAFRARATLRAPRRDGHPRANLVTDRSLRRVRARRSRR